jgi:hypothetical protein
MGFTRLSNGPMVRKLLKPLVYITKVKHISKPGKVVTSQYTCMFSADLTENHFLERNWVETLTKSMERELSYQQL